MTARPTNPWEPIHVDSIVPTRSERTRSAVVLVLLLTALGVALAAFLGLVVVALLALVGASIG